ncbi:hypothetical protein [Vibrio sp. SCSIO 43136]|uniref:hypothetical protein n=1 Tax=Vibrio sp. SCSIO 43136 TaxID=2819101 RepID=UPI002075DD06|nr:hypothetical protein [Vibrio sp. SCSIO 43136]USD65902.1 hypothetical protein J4N39_03510 [Vibrio sp. SCSIO 43136]
MQDIEFLVISILSIVTIFSLIKLKGASRKAKDINEKYNILLNSTDSLSKDLTKCNKQFEVYEKRVLKLSEELQSQKENARVILNSEAELKSYYEEQIHQLSDKVRRNENRVKNAVRCYEDLKQLIDNARFRLMSRGAFGVELSSTFERRFICYCCGGSGVVSLIAGGSNKIDKNLMCEHCNGSGVEPTASIAVPSTGERVAIQDVYKGFLSRGMTDNFNTMGLGSRGYEWALFGIVVKYVAEKNKFTFYNSMGDSISIAIPEQDDCPHQSISNYLGRYIDYVRHTSGEYEELNSQYCVLDIRVSQL